MSKLSFTPYTNFKKRFGLPIRSYLWLKENSWVISGDSRLMVYPSYTWGLGRQYKAWVGKSITGLVAVLTRAVTAGVHCCIRRPSSAGILQTTGF
ncbi:hypothetical protein [Dyadobacter jiangsuensis]|uniref:hypothetical protein n=1 Tax=Dyadobacter jiangsuensis TaxID=1591085 RepID=UPI001B809559|nr:hypothetical protein [Dyadobacter jiangsuensis]